MFKDYLKKTYAVYLLYFLFVCCTFIVLMICQMLSDLIVYMLCLYLFIILIYFFKDYRKYKNHHRNLEYLKENLDFLDDFPQDIYLEEKTYQEIIQQLHKKAFQLSKDNQQKYNEMIDYYTKWVHQIKTPIAGLKLIIQNDYPDEKMLVELLKIEQYVNMALQYVRLDHIHHDLSFQKVSLDDLVSQEIKKQSLFFFQKNLKVDYQIQDQQILTDEKWSSFVIEQVLSNALKYTKEGSITFYNDHEKLYIKDSGIGIKESDLPRVFERGFTGFQGRNDKKASGLGLYLCKNIFDQLGHLISIESKVGQGTTVCLDFSKKEIFIE